MKARRSISSHFVKYLSVGIFSNGLAYAMYVGIVVLGVNPVASMTIVYLLASSFAFQVNKTWTFRSGARLDRAFLRYVVAQILGYITNLIVLAGLHYGCGVPYFVAQLFGMGIVAVVLFLLSRYYVFV